MEHPDNLVRGPADRRQRVLIHSLHDYSKVLVGRTVRGVGVGRDGDEGDYIVVTFSDGARLYADLPVLYLDSPEATSPRASAPGRLRVPRKETA